MAYLEYKPTDVLYHYTTTDGFKGIIGSKKLWFSDLRTTNDPREIIFGLGRIRPIVARILKNFEAQGDIAPLNDLIETIFVSVKNTTYYCCCFSPFGDQLPMWRSYSSTGDGVSIGFRPRALYDLHGRFNRVDYFPEAESDVASDSYLEDIIRQIFQRVANYRVELSLEQRIGFATEIISKCTSIKHASWEYEREVRCVYSQSNSPHFINGRIVPTVLMADGSEQGPFEVKHREAANGRVGFHEFSFGKSQGNGFDASGAIARVVVGPKSKLSVPDVKALLNSEGFTNFEVVQSECSWR